MNKSQTQKEKQEQRPQCPEQNANIISRIFLGWVFPLVLQGWRSPLQDKHLWELPDRERGHNATKELVDIIHKLPSQATVDKDGKRNKYLFAVIRKAYRWDFLKTGILKGLVVGLGLVNPILLNQLIKFVGDYESKTPRPSVWIGVGWAASLLIVPIVYAIIENHYFLLINRTGMRVRSALQGILYDKSLSMSPSARAGSSLGEIVNLMQMDTQRISMFAEMVHLLWSAPLQLIVVCILLFNFISWSAVIGILTTALAAPIQAKIMGAVVRLRKQAVGITDERVKLVNEVLQGVKAVKLYAWETPFTAKIEDKRNQEIRNFKKTFWLNSIFTSFMISVPVIVSVVTFSFYAGVFKNTLEPAKVFTAFTLLNILRAPIFMLPRVLQSLIDTLLGLDRMEKFLAGEDTDDYSHDDGASSDEPHIVIEKGSFKWGEPGPPLTDPSEVKKKRWTIFKPFKKSSKQVEKEEHESNSDEFAAPKPDTLQNVNINIEGAKLTALVGRVGAGKTSLVSAILGEMQKTSGQVSLNGSVAYVAQTAWIFNDTLKNNILFGKEYDEELYKKAIKVSALKHDIDVLPAGDLTSIGEKGINLSGGQKQRVSIARAVYADRDVYIFDDPLSALDAHVSQKVFDQCISNAGALKDRLRLVITNQVSVLPSCDNIIFLEEGRIRNQGTYSELVAKDASFQEFVSDQRKSKDEEVIEENLEQQKLVISASALKSHLSVNVSISHDEEVQEEGKNLIQDEDRNVGNIQLQSYYKYAVACGGVVLFGLTIAFWAFVCAVGLYSSYWLSFWTDEQTKEIQTGVTGRGLGFYVGIYFLLGVGYAILLCLCRVTFQFLALRASRNLHKNALSSMMKAPMAFFDTTPIGRILSRFSRDVAAVDLDLPERFGEFLNFVLSLVGSYILIATILPLFLAAAVPVTIGYWLLQRFFNRTSLEVKRLDSISKSPIYAHFSETLSGLSTIRAYNKQGMAIDENREMIDVNTRAYFSFIAGTRWFSLYLELLGSTLIFFTALFAVIAPGASSAAEIGLSLSYILQVTSILGLTIRSITEVESQMSSVERLEHYGKELPQEADAVRDYDDLPDNERPSRDWPQQGAIEIDDVSLRYREGLELVLKGVCAKVEPGQKVGVIGRTGSGKSTLMVALLRLVELAGGSIKVDGVNLSNLGLDHLRKTITIIPQDPFLFSGTIRFNLDPFNLHSDVELWDALEKSSMKHFVEEFDGGLDSFVSEYGENLSAGQRQLICLTRALLRKSKILILDEASSSLDAQTDRLIQESIRTHMNDATILTIAHRLSTLADYDRILVMESGKVAEFDSPYNLLQDGESKLTGFVESLGKEGADQFREIVRNTHNIEGK